MAGTSVHTRAVRCRGTELGKQLPAGPATKKF